MKVVAAIRPTSVPGSPQNVQGYAHTKEDEGIRIFARGFIAEGALHCRILCICDPAPKSRLRGKNGTARKVVRRPR